MFSMDACMKLNIIRDMRAMAFKKFNYYKVYTTFLLTGFYYLRCLSSSCVGAHCETPHSNIIDNLSPNLSLPQIIELSSANRTNSQSVGLISLNVVSSHCFTFYLFRKRGNPVFHVCV